VAKAVRDVGNTEGVAKIFCPVETDLQVTYQRLAAHEKLVGLQVPRTDLDAASACMASEVFLLLRANLQVVVQDDRLTVEHEVAEVGVTI